MTWLLFPVVVALCWYLARRRHRSQRRRCTSRTARHEAYLAAVTEWLQTPKIVDAIVRHGVATKHDCFAFLTVAGELNEKGVTTILQRILQNREVRKVVTKHVVRTHGANKHRFMSELSHIAEGARA